MDRQDSRLQYLLVLGANATVIILSFLLNIIMTQTMKAEEFGYYRAFVNSVTMLTTLSSLGISLTISREYALKTSEEARVTLTGATYIINFIISFCVFSMVMLLGIITREFEIGFPSYLILAAAFIWLMLLNRFYLFKFQGENNMLLYSVLTVVPQALLTIIFIVFQAIDVAISRKVAILSYIASYLVLLVIFFLQERPCFKNVGRNIKRILEINKAYGFQLYIGSLASVASVQIMNLMVASLSGLESYAYFTLGVSLATPVMQVPSIMGTISFKKNVSLERISRKQMVITFGITILAIILYSIFLKFIICNLIGKSYTDAISYALIMVYYYAFMGLGDFFNRFVSAKGYGKEIRNNSFWVGGCLLICSFVLIPTLGISGIVISETISGLLYFLLMLEKYARVLRLEKKKCVQCTDI